MRGRRLSAARRQRKKILSVAGRSCVTRCFASEHITEMLRQQEVERERRVLGGQETNVGWLTRRWALAPVLILVRRSQERPRGSVRPAAAVVNHRAHAVG